MGLEHLSSMSKMLVVVADLNWWIALSMTYMYVMQSNGWLFMEALPSNINGNEEGASSQSRC